MFLHFISKRSWSHTLYKSSQDTWMKNRPPALPIFHYPLHWTWDTFPRLILRLTYFVAESLSSRLLWPKNTLPIQLLVEFPFVFPSVKAFFFLASPRTIWLYRNSMLWLLWKLGDLRLHSWLWFANSELWRFYYIFYCSPPVRTWWKLCIDSPLLFLCWHIAVHILFARCLVLIIHLGDWENNLATSVLSIFFLL